MIYLLLSRIQYPETNILKDMDYSREQKATLYLARLYIIMNPHQNIFLIARATWKGHDSLGHNHANH